MTEPQSRGVVPWGNSRGMASANTGSQSTNLADILERVLDKGVVIAGDIRVNLLDIELLTIKIRLLIVSVDKAAEMGIDWWRTDPMLSSAAQDEQSLRDENARLRERLEALESGRSEPGALESSNVVEPDDVLEADEFDDVMETDESDDVFDRHQPGDVSEGHRPRDLRDGHKAAEFTDGRKSGDVGDGRKSGDRSDDGEPKRTAQSTPRKRARKASGHTTGHTTGHKKAGPR